MRFFRQLFCGREVVEVAPDVDPEASAEDLGRALAVHHEALNQAAQAKEVVSSLAYRRIRNGFAPAIEESIINKHLGGAT